MADEPFDVFLSHSSDDDRVVGRLHRLLETYRPPRRRGAPRPRRLRVFHYRLDQPLSDSLTRALLARVDESRTLVLAASDAAASAPLVELETARFLETRGTDGIHIALVAGSMPEAMPPAVRERLADEPIYCDVRGGACKWLRWILIERRRFRGALFPLLATLYGERPDDLVQRDRRRARRRLLATLVPVLAIAAVLTALVLRSPSAAWMPTSVEGLSIADASFIVAPGGREVARVLLAGEMRPGGEEIRVTRHVVLDIDAKGHIIGSLVYSDRNGSVQPEIGPDAHFGPLGTLATDREILVAVQARRGLQWREVPVFLQRGGSGIVDVRGAMSGPLEWPPADRASEVDVEARVEAAARARTGVDHLVSRLYRPGGGRLLAFLDADLPGQATFGKQAVGMIPLVSEDFGRTWTAGEVSRVVASGVTDVSATPGGALYLAARDTFLGEDYQGGPGGVYRSRSGGLSWERVPLPAPWDSWPSFSGVVATRTEPYALAAATDPYVERGPERPTGVPGVLVSGDGGASWALADEGLALPRDARIRLLGIAGGGEVVALAYPDPGGPYWFPVDGGRLIIHRRLTLLERLRATYGVSY